MSVLTLLALSTFIGCGDKDDSTPIDSADTADTQSLDQDGDGVSEIDDCDDDNASVYPGASEVCDGLDNDCDDSIDEDVLQSFYLDADDDGYGDTSEVVEACEPPTSKYVTVDGDCDDSEEDVYPGASEICGDGLQNDCDMTEQEARNECRLSGIDIVTDFPTTSSYTGSKANDDFGVAVAGCDFDNDGVSDLVISATQYNNDNPSASGTGEVRVYLSSLVSSSKLPNTSKYITLSGLNAEDFTGASLARECNDIDNDGYDDLFIGVSRYDSYGYTDNGAYYGISGKSLTKDMKVNDQDFISGVTGGDESQLGRAIATGNDFALISVNPNSNFTLYRGYNSELLERGYYSDNTSDWVGTQVTAGDINGDGQDDSIIGAPGYGPSSGTNSISRNSNSHGAVFLFTDEPTGYVLTDDADYSVEGRSYEVLAGDPALSQGTLTAADLNNDGYEDFLAATSTGNSERGIVYAFLGGPKETLMKNKAIDTSDADCKWIGTSSVFIGGSVSTGDLDGDGNLDVVIGRGLLTTSDFTGNVVAFYDPDCSGVMRADDADFISFGKSITSLYGLSSHTLDANGDGFDDILAGAYLEGSNSQGAAYLTLGFNDGL